MVSHVFHSFFPDAGELISEAIPYCRLTYFDSKPLVTNTFLAGIPKTSTFQYRFLPV